MAGLDSRQYSWLWVSHISPKNSKWLQENLSDMDLRVKAMIKLINEDADSFARRAEMYYKKRPELMKQVEEFYRAYRALAERYDQATGALRQAHKTISEAFPNQMPSISDESTSSSGQEVESRTPEMSSFSRAPFNSDDHYTSKRNGTHSEETSALSNQKSLKQSNDLSVSSENAPRAIFDGKARKGLSFGSPEVNGKEDSNNEMVNLQQEIAKLLTESQNLKQQMLSESERANKAETEIQSLKDTVLQLNSEKGTSLLQYNQSTERLSTLESELSRAQADLKKLSDEMASEVQKLNSAESRNSVIQSELEYLDEKAKIQQQELLQKLKELENVQLSFQEEHEKRMHAENALISEGKERAQSQEEVQRLTMDIKMANEKLNELMQSKLDLESAVSELKKEIRSLSEQNCNSELLIQELRDEINSLRDSKKELLSEIQGLRSTILQLKVEKDGALLQHQKSVERVFVLESQLLNLQSELEVNEKRVQMLTQDLKQKRDEVDNVQVQLQDECHRSAQTEAALFSAESLHSQLLEEMKSLKQDLDTSTKKLSELVNDKLDLENISKELKNAILDLNCEKDAALVQQQQSLEKVSDLELQLSKTQLDVEKSEQKMQILELEIVQKSESVNSLELSLKDEAEKRVQAETSLMSLENMYSRSQEEVSRLHLEIEKLNAKLNELENLSSELNSAILLLNTEKSAILVKNQQSSTRVSDLESELSKLQAELEKVEGKVQVLEQELEHKQEEVGSLQTILQDEAQKRNEGEVTLLSVTNLHSESQEEVNRLALMIEELTKKLSEMENSKMELENIVCKHTEDIRIICDQNLSTELAMKDLRCELDAAKELNVKLETEVGLHIGEKEVLQRDFSRQREEKENLEETHNALGDEMEDLKSSAATNQKLIEELQITNLKLKEVSAHNLIERALLLEKVQEMEKLTEEYKLLENSFSDANAEMEALRENIKALDSSESSLKDEVSSHVLEKAVLTLELETIGKSFAEISENNSVLQISLSDTKAGLEDLRTKLKDSEETSQAQLVDISVLSAEKNNLFSQLENITLAMKALEGKHAGLEEKHSSLSRENDLAYDRVRELQGLLTGGNEEYDVAVKSQEMHTNSLQGQISSLQEKIHGICGRLEQEEQKSMSASICVVVLENSLADMKDKNAALFNECQKYVEANSSAEILILQLRDETRYHKEERKTLLHHNQRLREGISQHMKVLNIYRDLGPADIAQGEIHLQTVSDEILNVLKLKEESEDVNNLLHTELSVLATVLLETGLEFRDLHLHKSALEKELKSEAAKFVSLQNSNRQLLEWNEQLKKGLQKGSEREDVLKTEVLALHEKLSDLRESYQTSQDAIIHLNRENEYLSKDYQSLIEKYNALEDENGTVFAECIMFDHLSLFLRGHNNEVASALVSLTDEVALLSIVNSKLDNEVKVLSTRAMMLETENNHLRDYLVYLVEVLSTQIVMLEFDLNTTKSVSQELFVELENCMAQLMQKDDELLEAEEKVQSMQEKNRELCGVIGALQVAMEGAKVVKAELEKKIMILTEESITKDDEILLLRQANETLQVEADILKEEKESLSSTHELMSKEVEQHEREFIVLAGEAIISSVNAAVYEEKALKFMTEGKATEINVIAQKELILKELSAQDACIEALQKKVTGMHEENDELNAKLSSHLALVASLSDHVDVLEEGTLSLSKSCGWNTETKELQVAAHAPSMREGNHGLGSHQFPGGIPELQQLIRRIEALQVVILNVKGHQDQESANYAEKLATAHIEIQGLRARGGPRMDAKETYFDSEKQKDAEGSKGKQVQMVKDIELDQISTCPPYGTGAALYPLGNGRNAELDDEMLQLWEAAEKSCKNQTAKSSSSEHDIQAVEEVKSEYPSSELLRGRDLGINKLEMSSASALGPHEAWGKNVVESLTSDARRLRSIQASIEELKQKTGGSSKGKSPMNSEYDSVSAQLHDTEGFVLEQINLNNKMSKKAENYLELSDSVNAEREGYPSRRKISEQVLKGSENVGRLELELQKIQYVLLKLEEEQEYRRLKISDKRTRVLLRDYLYGRKDHGGAHKKRAPFCGCVRTKSRTEP